MTHVKNSLVILTIKGTDKIKKWIGSKIFRFVNDLTNFVFYFFFLVHVNNSFVIYFEYKYLLINDSSQTIINTFHFTSIIYYILIYS